MSDIRNSLVQLNLLAARNFSLSLSHELEFPWTPILLGG
jgi:hypothetical protein